MSRYNMTDFEWHVLEPRLPNKTRQVFMPPTRLRCVRARPGPGSLLTRKALVPPNPLR
jgi:hypothetical protein